MFDFPKTKLDFINSKLTSILELIFMVLKTRVKEPYLWLYSKNWSLLSTFSIKNDFYNQIKKFEDINNLF